MAHGFKRMGRDAGSGFYDYDAAPPALWSGLRTFERRSRALGPDVVRDRLLHAALKAALEHQGDDPRGAAAVLGADLPRNRDAALAFLAARDREAFEARGRDLAARFGDRFLPGAPAPRKG